MANNNVQNIKFLRNGVVFEPSNGKTARQVALDALERQKANLADGTAILGRYQETNGDVKTLVGFAYIGNDAKTLTVFDVDGAITNAINELDGSVVAESGFYVKSVTEVNGKINGTTEALPSLKEVKEIGKPIVAVSENKGQVAASAGNINAKFVNIADNGGKFTAKTVEDALAEIATEIDAMDSDVVSGDGEVITAVSEKDGKVFASKTAIKDVKLTGYVKSTTATGAISGNDDIEDALSKLENNIAASQSATTVTNTDHSINVTTDATGTTIGVNINSSEKVISLGNDGIYTDIKLSAVTVSEANVKEAFALIASDGATQLGSTIKIYKDSSLLSVALLHADYSDPQNPVLPTYDKINGWTDIASPTQANQALCFAYENVEGNVVVAAVPVGSFINEQEFASGLTWDSTAGKVIGVVDSTSEKDSSKNSFLTVGADGFKVDGIKGEIDTKINALDATVGSTNVESGKHVAVQVVEDAGKLTALTVTENDIASAQGLADEITARGNADTELSNRLGDGVTTTNTASEQLSALSGTSEDASGVTSVWGAKKYAQQYADEKVATVVDALDATVNGQTADGKVKVQVVQENGVLSAVTVTSTDIASDSALAAEIAARKDVDGQTGQTYAANTSSSYINNANSLNDADVKLAAALKTLDDDAIKSVKVNDVKLAETSNAVNVQISSVKANGTDSSPIVVDTDDTGAVTLQILQIDCGEY